MTIESIRRISITAMVLLLVLDTAAAQTTSTPLYLDGVLRVVATFHRIHEGSLPVSGSMESFGASMYPSWPPGRAENADDSSKHRRRGSEDGAGKVYSTGLARQAKDERGAAGTDCRSTEGPVGETKEGGGSSALNSEPAIRSLISGRNSSQLMWIFSRPGNARYR